ncbi:hypothetical protein TDB9533_02499 [Thalassocella blandensis]|nr:hypothetical protein TDB9533_02499 [Thalassocella blandensis]
MRKTKKTNIHKVLTHIATGLVVAMLLGFILAYFPQLNFFSREPLMNIMLLMVLGLNAGLISALISNPEIDIDPKLQNKKSRKSSSWAYRRSNAKNDC